jgi:hypothetical protein
LDRVSLCSTGWLWTFDPPASEYWDYRYVPPRPAPHWFFYRTSVRHNSYTVHTLQFNDFLYNSAIFSSLQKEILL